MWSGTFAVNDSLNNYATFRWLDSFTMHGTLSLTDSFAILGTFYELDLLYFNETDSR